MEVVTNAALHGDTEAFNYPRDVEKGPTSCRRATSIYKWTWDGSGITCNG